jgi:hypothetical protein
LRSLLNKHDVLAENRRTSARILLTGAGSGERDMTKRTQCSKSLTEKSRSRADEAQRDGTLILLERVLQCECGARVGARFSATGQLVPTRHNACEASSPTLSTGGSARLRRQIKISSIN